MWQNGYPNRDVITRDVTKGISYIADDDGEVAGFMTLITSEEEFQSTIDTQWNGKNCTVMHRLLVAPDKRNMGVGTMLMELWEHFSRRLRFDSMRTETDATNIPMRSLLEKCGLKEIGVLQFDNSDKLAFRRFCENIKPIKSYQIMVKS